MDAPSSLAAVAGVGEEAHPVRLQAARDPHLLPVDDPVATLLLRL